MKKTNNGFALVEVLLSAALLGMVVVAVVSAILYGEEGAVLAGMRNRAVMYGSEAIAAVRNIRDAAFSNLTDGTYGLSALGNIWSFSGSSDSANSFTRSVTVATATEGARYKDVTVNVSWQQNLLRTGAAQIVAKITDWRRAVGNWTAPGLLASLNLPGNTAGNKVAFSGNYAYVVRQGGAPDFAVIDVSNPAAPSLVGSLTVGTTLNNIVVSGNYAYVATAKNTSEMVVVDISNPASPTVVASFNASGSNPAYGIYKNGNYVFLTRSGNSSNFLVINVAVPLVPVQVSSINLSGTAYELWISGNYAYVASGYNVGELEVIDISNLLLPVQVASTSLTGNADAVTITGYGTVAFLGQNNGYLTSVNISNPLAPTVMSSVDAGTSVNDLTLGAGNGYVFAATSNGSGEFELLDATTPSSLSILGSLNLAASLNGVVYDDVRDKIYCVGTDNNQEFLVMQPG